MDGLVFENAIRKMQDIRDRAVIPFQADKRTFFEVIAEAIDVSYIRPTESVNGLVIIAHNKQRLAIAQQRFHKTVLRRVDVLVFIDENLGPLILEICARLFVIFEQINRLVNEVFENNLPGFQDTLTQRFEFFEELRGMRIREKLFAREAEFSPANFRKFLHKSLVCQFRRDRHFLETNKLVRRARRRRNFRLEDKQRKRVERAESHTRIREKLLHTFPHFGSRFRRERERQNFFRHNAQHNPVLDSLGQDRSLSRTRPSQN